MIGFLAILVWLVTAGIWRYSSGAAIAAFMLLPVLAAGLRADERFVAFTAVVSALILWRHKDNMSRLWNGTEPKIGGRREQVV